MIRRCPDESMLKQLLLRIEHGGEAVFILCTLLFPFFSAAAAFLLPKRCHANTAARSARPIISVTSVGSIIRSPPAAARMRTMGFICLSRWPFIAAATPKMPRNEVMTIWIIDSADTSMSSIAGFMQKIYGTMKAPMASFVAFTPVFIGLPFAIAAPA